MNSEKYEYEHQILEDVNEEVRVATASCLKQTN